MIRILAGLPRPNGVGEYVAQLAALGPSMEVFYGGPMSPGEYEATGPDRPGPARFVRDYVAVRRQPAAAIDRTHVAWEGLGPVYGRRTRLLTVHHVLGSRIPWRSAGGRLLRDRAAFALARRGHRRTAALGIRVVVPSASTRDDLVRGYGADPARIAVIPHYLDLELFRPMDRADARRRLGLPADAPVLLHVGVDDGRKNLGRVLEIHRSLARRRPELHLVQIGRSPAVEAEIRREPRARIVYRPNVPGPERPAWYAASDVVVLPSWLEGFGRAALEARAMDRPVVVSDLPVFREDLDDGARRLPMEPLGPWVEAAEAALGESPDGRGPSAVARRFGRASFERGYRALYRELRWGVDDEAGRS